MDLKFNGVKIEEAPDPRDFHVSKFVPHVDVIEDEEFILNLPKLNIILDQGQYGACVGHSFIICKSILEYNGTNKWPDFDPFALYADRLKGEHDGEGMYLTQAAKTLKNVGAYFRRDFGKQGEMPEFKNVFESWRASHPELVKQAKNYVITGYGQANSVEEIKQYLKRGMPVSASFPVYDALGSAKDGVVSTKLTGQIRGYHCMTIVGWRKDNRWIVVNSWGTAAGMKGLYYIPFSYPRDCAYGVSDTIFPARTKAKEIVMTVGSKDYTVDGEPKTMDVNVIEENGRTYVPVRFVAESLGAMVEWDEAKKCVTITSEEGVIQMYVGNKVFVVNGRTILNDVAPIQLEDRVRLPIRIVAEALHCEVEWNEAKQQVKIISL